MLKNTVFLFTIAAIIVLPSFLFAQKDTLEASYIDLETARKTIEKLENANTEYNNKIKELEAQNNQMNQEINQLNEKLSIVINLIEKFKKNGLTLYEQSLTVVDKDGRKKATEAYEDNKQTITKLFAKKFEIESKIKDNTKAVGSNEYEISIYMNRINNNNEEISELEKSIEKTLSKINEIENQIDSTSKLIDEAADVLE